MQGLVTVIIPVYNVEKYLKQCVDSVVCQTYKNLEIILVNDGSTDTSGQLCENIKATDNRINVYHKKNGGLSTARNFGLQNTSGEYVLFLDSDDYYADQNTIKNLVDTSLKNDSDLVLLNYKRFYQATGKFSNSFCVLPQNQNNNLENLIKHNIYTSSACLKLIKTSCILQNNLLFEAGVLSEDIEFSAKLILYCKNIVFCDAATYIYRCRTNSITTSVSLKHIKDLYNIVFKLSNIKTENSLFYHYLAFQYATLLINICNTNVEKTLKQNTYKLKHLLKYNLNKKVKLINICNKFLGIKITSYLLNIYFNLISKS